MNMLDVTKAELQKHGALTPLINPHIQKIMNSISFVTVPDRMKTVIAISQLSTFASQFKRNLLLWDETKVPLNAISFVITDSGNNKDSSVKAARKCFKPGYEKLLEFRKQEAINAAIKLAEADGETSADDEAVYLPYMLPLPPIDIMPTTGPGFIQHVNDIGKHAVTSGYLYSGEFGDELAYNQDMMENIKIISELYDTGDKEVKYTKTVEFRSEAIEAQPVSALLVTSPTHILHDESTKKKFTIAFMSKLARRSWFCFTPDKLPEPDFTQADDPIQAMFDFEDATESQALAARENIKQEILDITDFGLSTKGNLIGVTTETTRLFKTYKRYNSELADSLPNQHSTSVLVRRHLQWKALKLAGALALFDKSDQVEAKHYIDAIRLAEMLSNDMAEFEAHLNKSQHEQFADYMQTLIQVDGTAEISIHDLKKRGFVSSTSKAKLDELCTLANAYDSDGIYSTNSEGSFIHLEKIVKSDTISISYKPVDIAALDAAVASGNADAVANTKVAIAASAVYGYEIASTEFSKLDRILAGSFAFSPFKFKDGTRGKDHILPGTKWLVLDIDDSNISAQETSFMLSDINHHIALTSDPSNEFKFRVFIELDAIIDLNPIKWKHFYLAIAESLALKADPLPQSQIFYSYEGRQVYSNTDASPLATKEFLIAASEAKVKSKPIPSSASARAQLADPEVTFSYAFEAPYGAGSRSMIRAAYHARDLGATKAEIIQLMHDINDYWEYPLDTQRFEHTILGQIERW